MGNEWEIEIWSNDPDVTGRSDAEYEWIEVGRGDGVDYLAAALAQLKPVTRRPIRVTYRGWVENVGEMARD